MPGEARNRALRALVAELAQLGDDDVEAILADLAPRERDRLLSLMDEYRPGQTRPDAAETAALNLNPWLADRLEGRGSPAMTAAAAEALRESAAEAGWRGSPAAPAGVESRRGFRSWLGGGT